MKQFSKGRPKGTHHAALGARHFDKTEYGLPLLNIMRTHQMAAHGGQANPNGEYRCKNARPNKAANSQKAFLDINNQESYDDLKKKNFDAEKRKRIMDRQRK